MKRLCTTLAALCVVAAVCAGAAAADSNNLTFNETQGADGLWHIDIGVTYVFPGMPPRDNNFGLGTVLVSLPGANVAIDSSQPVDPYSCTPLPVALGEPVSGVTCSTDGQATGGGLTFPTSIAVHLTSKDCWTLPDGSPPASAQVWAAPNNPGTDPDVTLPIDPGSSCSGTQQQPVLQDKPLRCTVPNLKGMTLAVATHRLAVARCARGKLAFKRSSKVRKGRVISQSIKPGKVLPENAKVNVVVSRG